MCLNFLTKNNVIPLSEDKTVREPEDNILVSRDPTKLTNY